MHGHRFLSASALSGALVACALCVGCASTEHTVRVVARGGAFRDGIVVPTVEPRAPRVIAGPDVLTDDELAALEARLGEQLPALVHKETLRATTDPVGVSSILRSGTLKATRLRVRATAGREQHRTVAECRVQITVGDDVIADAEGTALRIVQARNVSLLELPSIEQQMREQGGRHPLLDVRDSEAALLDACRAAIAAAVDDTRPDDHDRDVVAGKGIARASRQQARAERRRRALARLEQGTSATPRRADTVAAALVELGESGGLDDAALVRPFVVDTHPLVQRASASALGALCAGHAVLPAAEGAAARCAPWSTPSPPPLPSLSPPAPSSDDVATPSTDDEEDDEDDDALPRESQGPAESAGP
jgi:hypothetical protein